VRITDVRDTRQVWDTKFDALFSSGKEFGIKEAVVVCTLDAAMSGSSWKFIAAGERLCSLHMRTNY